MNSKRLLARRSRAILLRTCALFVLLQVSIALFPGYPWPHYRRPEKAVGAERFVDPVIHCQIDLLLRCSEPLDVAFFGDSSCLMGVMPQVLCDATGLKARGFATFGWLSTEGHAETFEMRLARYPAPKIAVYHVTPATLRQSKADTARIGYLKQFRKWMFGDVDDDDSPIARLPGFRLRWLGAALADSLTGRADRERRSSGQSAELGIFPTRQPLRDRLFASRGFLQEEHPDTVGNPVLADAELLSPDALAGLQHLFRVADAYGVKLLVVLQPAPEQFRSPREDQAFCRLEEKLRDAAHPYRTVEIAKPLLRYYRDEDFATTNHLGKGGARRNTLEITRLIQTALVRGTLNGQQIATKPRTAQPNSSETR